MANTSNAITTGFARYDAVLVLDDALLVEEPLEEPLVLGGGGDGVLLVELVPGLGGEVLFVALVLGGASMTSSIGVDRPKTVTLPTYTPGSLGALNLIGNLTSEVVPLAPGGMMMLNV